MLLLLCYFEIKCLDVGLEKYVCHLLIFSDFVIKIKLCTAKLHSCERWICQLKLLIKRKVPYRSKSISFISILLIQQELSSSFQMRSHIHRE